MVTTVLENTKYSGGDWKKCISKLCSTGTIQIMLISLTISTYFIVINNKYRNKNTSSYQYQDNFLKADL